MATVHRRHAVDRLRPARPARHAHRRRDRDGARPGVRRHVRRGAPVRALVDQGASRGGRGVLPGGTGPADDLLCLLRAAVPPPATGAGIVGRGHRAHAVQRVGAGRGVPSRQSEAAYAIGLRKGQLMRHILVPQAARAMLPVIISQLVVLLKDTALGYIIAYPELLELGVNQVSANFGNVVAAAIVAAAIYIAINSALTAFAGWLERHTRRAGRVVVAPTTAAGPMEMETAAVPQQ